MIKYSVVEPPFFLNLSLSDFFTCFTFFPLPILPHITRISFNLFFSEGKRIFESGGEMTKFRYTIRKKEYIIQNCSPDLPESEATFSITVGGVDDAKD